MTDAARIARSMPGRAFARVGQSELTEFQAAYVGGDSMPGRPASRSWSAANSVRPAPLRRPDRRPEALSSTPTSNAWSS